MSGSAEETIWEAVGRTGLTEAAHEVDRDGHVDRKVGRFDPLRDPSATELLASAVADAARGAPTAVLVPDGVGAAVLGFAVGVRFHAPVIRLFIDEGLVVNVGEIRPGARALIVSPLADDLFLARAEGYLRSGRADVVDALAILYAGPSRMRALVALQARRYPAEACPVCGGADGERQQDRA